MRAVGAVRTRGCAMLQGPVGASARPWVRQRPRPGWCATGGAVLRSTLAGDLTTVRARPTDAYAASCDGDGKTRWRAAACRHSLIRRCNVLESGAAGGVAVGAVCPSEGVARHEKAREFEPGALSSLAWGAGTAWPRQGGVGSCRRQSRSRATEFYSSAQNAASGISNARSTARITGIETSTVGR